MKPSVSIIVQDLIDADPSLEPRRKELTANVKALLAARPDTPFTDAFKHTLLEQLRSTLSIHPSSHSFPLMAMLNKILLAGGGAVAGALVAILIVTNQPGAAPVPLSDDAAQMAREEAVSPAPTVTSTAANAFGSLAMDTSARPQSGGGGGYGLGGGGDAKMMVDSMIMPAPDMVAVDYLYDGELTLPTTTVEVLRRTQPSSLPAATTGLLQGSFAEGIMNWSSLPGLRTQMVSVMQSGTEPWQVSVDFQDGTVSMNRMYDYSKMPQSNCKDDACYQRFRMKEADMLPDEQLMQMARDFVQKIGINISDYGDPVVDDDWRYWYQQTENKADYYFPDSITVTFPLRINGKEVYEQYGGAAGLGITIDLRRKEVSGVYNLRSQNYQGSAYEAATDEAAVRDFLRLGGVGMWRDPNGKVVQGSVLEPKEAYVRTHHWDEKTQVSSELYVPALVFPVGEVPKEAMQTQRRIVVPLAKELMQSNSPILYMDGEAPMIKEGE